MYYLINEYPNNILILNEENEILYRLMHWDYKTEELAIEQAEKLINILNK